MLIGNYTFPRACWKCMDEEPARDVCMECREKNTETVSIVASNAKGEKTIVEFGSQLRQIPTKMLRNVREEMKSE